MSHRQLIIFTRYPIPGLTKTRLIPALGEQGAADLQRVMTEHTVDCVRPLMKEGVRIEVRHEGADPPSMGRWLGEDLSFLPQEEGDLGVRMERAFRGSAKLGADKTVIIGTDCPDLAAEDIREAFNLLDSNPVVLGPATDGGYYLIGIRTGASERLYPVLFSGVPWGTGDVFSKTVNSLAAAGIEVGLLDEKPDVDEPEDLIYWENKMRAQEGEKADTRTRTRTSSPMPSTAGISVIIPTLKEEERVGGLISGLREHDVEIVVADGGSIDGTVGICRGTGVKVVTSGPGRAAQMNAGADKASGQIFLFLHADTTLPERFEDIVRGVIAGGAVGGAFSFGTDLDNISMRMITLAANLRTRLFGIVFGDQGIFVRADLFRKIGGFPDLPVMEDLELVRMLKRHGRFVILPVRAVSSARRWRANGVWRTTFMNQMVMWLYMLGMSPERLVRWYKGKLRVES